MNVRYIIVAVLLVALSASASANTLRPGTYQKIDMAQIDRYGTFRIDGGRGVLNAYSAPDSAVFTLTTFGAQRMKPNTDYTLVLKGDISHPNDERYATCIKKARSSFDGSVYMSGFTYTYRKNDGKEQRFRLVLSSDVDCTYRKMVRWNPLSYLFERYAV